MTTRMTITAIALAAASHQAAVEHHMRRALDDASREYALTLKLDPPREPGASQRTLVERLAPRVFVTQTEPFRLLDVAAIVHPDRPLIAYHLFWEDDIDYPDDNDPCDHEVVWVRYRPDGSIAQFWTDFHGRPLDGGEPALKDAFAHGMRPAVLIQWGKHGPMPAGWKSLEIVAEEGETESGFYPLGEPITLERYNRGTFDKLSTVGVREADHPLARRSGWPRRFSGNWAAFSTFGTPVDVLRPLRTKRMILVSRWNSATINQHFIRYNFKPKLEWPEDDE